MVIAHHLIWTVYGAWLPNDPRGSMSREIISPRLAALGNLHFGRRVVQPAARTIRTFYDRAEPQLAFPIIRFDANQIAIIASALADALTDQNYTCYACAIMPDHVHMIVRKHRDRAETMIDELQTATRLRFSANFPWVGDHPLWTHGGWKRFLNSPQRVRETIAYIERNPIDAGLWSQSWRFVTPYDDWPFHNRPR